MDDQTQRNEEGGAGKQPVSPGAPPASGHRASQASERGRPRPQPRPKPGKAAVDKGVRASVWGRQARSKHGQGHFAPRGPQRRWARDAGFQPRDPRVARRQRSGAQAPGRPGVPARRDSPAAQPPETTAQTSPVAGAPFSSSILHLQIPTAAPPVAPQPALPPDFRCGLAVLVGRTNVGKSTLLNALVGRKVSIVTPKPQTTRDPVHGVVHRPDGQIVFVDTPGLFKTTSNELVEQLHQRARRALEGIDVVVHVVDPARALGEEEDMVRAMLQGVAQPRVLCLNKCDLAQRPFRQAWLDRAAGYAAVVEVSGLKGENLGAFADALLEHLPVGPPLYPPEQFSNLNETFWMAEIIREKIYLLMGEEMPYHTRVQVEQIGERPSTKHPQPLLAVKAVILTDEDRRKAMLIGAGGQRIGEIGAAARRELEAALQRKVFLDLAVLVDRRLFRGQGRGLGK